ncbi:RING finger and CHY zinc finger domain-containing 1, partial [Paramuricea clavata]
MGNNSAKFRWKNPESPIKRSRDVVKKVFQVVGLKTVHQDLSSPIQESDTNGRECISLRDIPVERRTAASVTSTARNTSCSNGSKLSNLQDPSAWHNDVTNPMSPSVLWDLGQCQGNDDYLCGHYKRQRHVKCECRHNEKPCHRCHNDQSTCGRRKLTSRDTKMAKCVCCDKVQQFGQFRCNCGAKFAEYFCNLCERLTGKDDPYHCEKCGNCRVHGDRSFHCDVCGVCGNHKCREGSAHECCIHLE